MEPSGERARAQLAITRPSGGVVGAVAAAAVLGLASQAGAEEAGAFCELTPCIPGPVTRIKLTAERKVGAVTCKAGDELGLDTKKRVVFCTTAKVADVDGLPVAKDAYTLFHPSGRIYQTHARSTFKRGLADGSTVLCGSDLVALSDDGTLRYCKLAGPRAGSPRARVGEGIGFHPGGQIAAMTLDEPYTAAGITLLDGSTAAWDLKGTLLGGYPRDTARVGALSIKYEFELHPNGKPKLVTLASPAMIQGQELPASAKLAFRADGSLEAAEYIEKSGFMIHGEPWHDTRHTTFDPAGKIVTTHVEHYQAHDPPPKFRKR